MTRRRIVELSSAAAVLTISALLALGHDVGAVEESLFSWVNGWPNALEWPLRTVMQLGTLTAGAIGVLVLLALRRPRAAVTLAGAVLLAWLGAKGLKVVADRGRPEELVSDVVLRADRPASAGYPSGHTAVAFAIAAVVAVVVPRRFRLLVFVAAALVGIARIYVGAHFPLDVLGGAALGLFVAWTVDTAVAWRS